MEFIKENMTLILPLLLFIIGWLLPVPKFVIIGNTISNKIPEPLAIILAERLEAMAQGLYKKNTLGRTDLITNTDLEDEIKSLKIDLGLEGLSLKKKE